MTTNEQYVDDKLNALVQVCEVISVNEGDYTCVVRAVSSDLEISDVRLNASDGPGFNIIPKIGSFVYVVFPEIGEDFVARWSEVEKIIISGPSQYEAIVDNINIKAKTFEAQYNLTTYNRGANGGLVNVNPLRAIISAISAYEAGVAALFASANQSPNNASASAYAAFISAGMAALNATLTSAISSAFLTIEDLKFKH